MVNSANRKHLLGSSFQRTPLILTLALAAAGLILATTSSANNPVRTIAVLPLVLILPGYALTAAFFGNHLDLAATIVLSIGLSIAATVIGGLILNVTEVGLQTLTWAIWLTSITMVAGIIALLRRTRTQTPEVGVNPVQYMAYLPAVAATVAALVIFGLALMIARSGAAQQASTFTQLWLLPDTSAQGVIHIGIYNREKATVRYKLQLLANNQVVKEWTPIALNSNGEWVDTLTLPDEWARALSLDAVLYRLDQPDQVYRHVWLQHNGAAQ